MRKEKNKEASKTGKNLKIKGIYRIKNSDNGTRKRKILRMGKQKVTTMSEPTMNPLFLDPERAPCLESAWLLLFSGELGLGPLGRLSGKTLP
jgi:hypothetical protein